MNATRVRWLNLLVILALCWPLGSVAGSAAVLSPAQPVSPQASVALTLVGQAGGNVKTVAIEGTLAYVGMGAKLVVLDIANPAQPVFKGQTALLPGLVQDMALYWPHIYLATSTSISVVDINDPYNPMLVGSKPMPAQGIAFDPFSRGFALAYVVGNEQLTLLNVNDPISITEVMSYTFASPGWEDIALYGDRAYLAGGGLVQALDVISPTNVLALGNSLILGVSKTPNLAIADGNLYLAACEAGVRILSLANPAQPIPLGIADTQVSCAYGVAVNGTTAYVATGYDGLLAFDVSLPATPQFRSKTDTAGKAWLAVPYGYYAYIADGDGMRILDINSPNYPFLVGELATDRRVDYLTAADQTVYALDSQEFGGLRTYNVAFQAQPISQARLPHEWDTATNLAVLDDRAYYGLPASKRLLTASVVDPGHLFWMGALDLPFAPYGVAAFNEALSGHRYVAVAAGNDGLQVIDVSFPQQMQVVGSATAGDAQDVFFLNGRAYVADGINGLQIFDLSNPASPQWLGGRDTPGYARSVVVVGSLAYVADSDGLQILDVSDPASPTALGSYDTPGNAVRVRVLGRYAFIADDWHGVHVVDVNDPAAPAWDSSYVIPGNVTDLAVGDGFVYVAAGDAGLLVYQVNFFPAYVLNGSVADSSGIPVPDVALFSPGSGYIQHTTAVGGYEFFHMPAGSHQIIPAKAGYVFTPPERLINLTGALFNQDFTAVTLSYNVTGRVTDSSGQPIAGVTVADGLGNSTLTNSSGDYNLALLTGPHHFNAMLGQATFWPPERFVNLPPDLSLQDFTVPAPLSLAVNLYGGSGVVVARRGDMLYLQTGSGLAALNITRPYTPTLTGKTLPLPGMINGLAFYGRYAYAALDVGGLGVIDLINPLRPVTQNILPFSARVLGVSVDSLHLYLSLDTGLGVFSLANPAWPQMVGWLPLSGGGPLVVSAGVAYIGTACDGLTVADVSIPETPSYYQAVALPGCIQDIALSSAHIFTAVGGGPQNGLQVLDATSPLYPMLVYTETLPIDSSRLSLEAGFLYLSTDALGLNIYNVANPAAPAWVGNFPASYAYDSAVRANTVYLATAYDGLQVINALDRANLYQVNVYRDDFPTYAKDVDVQGALAYLVDYDGGLRIYNVTSPRNPHQLSKYNGVGDISSLAVQGDIAYLGTGEGGLAVVNVAEPLSPTYVTSYSTGNITDIALGSNLAYLAGYGPGLRILDISDPAAPTQLSEYHVISDTQRILLDGSLAYLTQPDLGLHVVDVSDPANPTPAGAYDPPELLYGMDMADGRLYQASARGLMVLDPANLNGPPLAIYETPSPAYDVIVVGHYACLATRDGLRVLNVINLQRIVEANFFPNIPAYYPHLALGSNALYLANETSGLAIFVVDAPRPQNVIPNSGVNDVAHTVAIRGLQFQPGAQVYLGESSLTAVSVISATLMMVDIPAGLLPGSYPLRVVNPDGGIGFLPNAYTAFINQPPTISQVTPGQGGNNFPVLLDIYGSNFAPNAAVRLSGPQNITFGFVLVLNGGHLRVIVPPGLATGMYALSVINPGDLVGTLPNAYAVRLPGDVNDLYAFVPDLFTVPVDARAGQPALLALKVRRQGGTVPLTNVAVDFYDGNPLAGGTLIGSSTIPGLLPGAMAASLPITYTPASAGLRAIYAVIDPAGLVLENDEDNNTIQRSVRVYPAAVDTTPPRLIDLSINDGAALTTNPLVYLNTVAEDEAGGSGLASVLFVEYEYIPSRGGWVAMAISDWLPYAQSSLDYPWRLAPSPGMHYLQAWVADQAGNVSASPILSWINYLPETAAITTYEVHTFRLYLNAGDILQANLTSVTGDADLYAFAPDASLLQKSETGGVDSVTITAQVDGVYQIEVEGVSDSTYQLALTVNGTSLPWLLVPTRPDPRGRGTPNSVPSDIPDDEVGLPGPGSEYILYMPLIMR